MGSRFERCEEFSSIQTGAVEGKLQRALMPVCSHGCLKAASSSGQSSMVSTLFLSTLSTQGQAHSSFLFITPRQRAGLLVTLPHPKGGMKSETSFPQFQTQFSLSNQNIRPTQSHFVSSYSSDPLKRSPIQRFSSQTCFFGL